MSKREIDDMPRAQQLLLRDIGFRARAVGCPIHPTELRRTLATVHLDDTPLDLDALMTADDTTFRGELLVLEAGLDTATGKLRAGVRPRFAAKAMPAPEQETKR